MMVTKIMGVSVELTEEEKEAIKKVVRIFKELDLEEMDWHVEVYAGGENITDYGSVVDAITTLECFL